LERSEISSVWLIERHHTKSALLTQDKLRREDLYQDVIVMASKVYADAMMHDEPQIFMPWSAECGFLRRHGSSLARKR
jgi:hypothetical protein